MTYSQSSQSVPHHSFFDDMNHSAPGVAPPAIESTPASSASSSSDFMPHLATWYHEAFPIAVATQRRVFGFHSFAEKKDHYEIVLDAYGGDQARANIEGGDGNWQNSFTNAINHPAWNRKSKAGTRDLLLAMHRGESIIHDVPPTQLAGALHSAQSGTDGEVPDEPQLRRRVTLVLPIKDYTDESDPSLPHFALKAAKALFPNDDETSPYQRNMAAAFKIIVKIFDHMAYNAAMEFWPFVTHTKDTAGMAPARWRASITTNIESARVAFSMVCFHVLHHTFIMDKCEMVGTQGWVEAVVLPSLMTSKSHVKGKYNLCEHIVGKTIAHDMASLGLQVHDYPPHADGMLSPIFASRYATTEKLHNMWRNLHRTKTEALYSAMGTSGDQDTTKLLLSGKLNNEPGQLHEGGKVSKFLYRSYQTTNCSVMKGDPLVRGSMNGSKKHLAHVDEKNNMAAAKLWRGAWVQLLEDGNSAPISHNIHDMIMDITRSEPNHALRAEYNAEAGDVHLFFFGIAERRAAAKSLRIAGAVGASSTTTPSGVSGTGPTTRSFKDLLEEDKGRNQKNPADDISRQKRPRDAANEIPVSEFSTGDIELQNAQAYSKADKVCVAASPSLVPEKKSAALKPRAKKAPKERGNGRFMAADKKKD